jgi:hypothetical protein
MRKLVISVALVAIALGGAAACAVEAPTTNPTTAAPTTTAAAADQSKSVCNEAVTASTSAGLVIQTKATDLRAALAANDLVKATQVGAELQKAASELSTKLTTLASGNIKPEIKTALTDLVTTINKHAAAGAQINTTQAESEITAGIGKLTTACAAA